MTPITQEATRAGFIDARRDAPEAYRALAALTRAGALEHRLGELVKIRASELNGCTYCVQEHLGAARRAGEDERRLQGLAGWRESPDFDARERAALALTEALTLIADAPLEEGVLAEAAAHFPPAELAALVVAITAINAWNRIMLASGGRPRHAEGNAA